MNISFDIKSNQKKIISDQSDLIKLEINQFKLKVDETIRYLSGFEFYNDDNLFMCYVGECEIEINYENNKIKKIDYYSNEVINKDLNELIDYKKSIKDNLIMINQYFYDNDPSAKEEEDEEEEKEEDEFLDSDDDDDKFRKTIIRRSRNRIEKVFESDDESDSESMSSIEENIVLKNVNPVKFDHFINIIKVINLTEEDIIFDDENETNNFIPNSIIDESKKNNKCSVVNQIVAEINKAIKSIKNLIIKPFNTVYEILIENKFSDFVFNYKLLIPKNYPFSPPKLEILSKYNQSFSYCLSNCSILDAIKWNPTTTLSDIILGIYNNVEKYDYKSITSVITDDTFYNLTLKLLQLTNTVPLNSKIYEFNFDFLKIQDKSESKGIGYEGPQWDYKLFQKEQILKLEKVILILDQIIPLISISHNIDYIEDTCLIPYVKQYINGISMIELDKNTKYYLNLFKIFNEIYKLEKYNHHFNLKLITQQKKNFKDYPEIYNCIPDDIPKESSDNTNEDYVSIMSDLAFNESNIIESKKFKFMNHSNLKHPYTNFISRVQKEISTISSNLPTSKDSSIFFRYDPSNIFIMKFLIIPNIDTPYAYGCFEFDMYLPFDFPNSPPHVEIITTGGGTFRFNPNLYAEGKVCLSLLGTWSGSDGEKWTTDSTILQILLSIQGLIFDKDPWFNEPGYEKNRNSKLGIESNVKYNDPIRTNNLKLAMVGQLLNPSHGFEDVIKNHFKLLQNDIYKKLDEWYEISATKHDFKVNYDKLKELISGL